MTIIPEESIDSYAEKMLKDDKAIENLVERAIELKLIEAVKKVVKLDEKAISMDDFNAMMQEK